MRLRALAVGVALLIFVSCTDEAPNVSQPTTTTSAGADTEATGADRRTAEIYAAIIMTLRREANPSPIVYVLDRADPGAARPTRRKPTHKSPISEAVQEAAVEELPRLELTFVRHGDDVLVEKRRCTQVKKGGSLVTLGLIPHGGETVEVAASSFTACLSALWVTYVVKHRDGGWEVTGTTGPVAIS
ncbi:MAG: hypothetical protein QOH26_1453 [Actinomycetota bacterium]|nr:hypothetical protein [Actinomycetota bacterium]